MLQAADKEIKIVVVGSSSVGKSSLLVRFIDSQFTESTLATIGVDFKFREMVVGGKRVKVQIWDTAGQEAFRAIVSAYYNGADGVMIVYDLACWETFQDVKTYWMEEVNRQKRDDTVVMLVGAKADLVDKRQVIKQTVEDFAKQQGIALSFETSSKNNTGIEQAFQALAKQILNLQGDSQPTKGHTVIINNPPPRPIGGAHDKPGNRCCSK